MSTTPTSFSHLDDGMRIGSHNTDRVGYYTHIPRILTIRIENANTIIDNLISEYNKYQVGPTEGPLLL